MILRKELREDISSRLCGHCGQSIPEDEDCILSFYRGEFILLHKNCYCELMIRMG